MSIFRAVSKYGPGSKGIAIGWLIGAGADAKIAAALPGWACAFTVEGPTAVTSADIQAARKAVGAPVNAPVILIGWSAGCQAVRSALISNCVEPWGVACFDGTHANVPPAEWQIKVWRDIMVRARAGLCRAIFTATQMAYTQDIPPGQPGRATPTSWVLAAALGVDALQLDAPIEDGGLYVALYPSDKGPTKLSADAHRFQVNSVAPSLLGRMADGPGLAPTLNPPPPPEDGTDAPPWKDPDASIGERLARWAEAETAAWKKNGWTEVPAGSNDSPRIRQYAGLPYKRRGSGAAMSGLRNVAWCAEGASFGVSESLLPGEESPIPYRVAGIEIEQDAVDRHRFQKDPREGRRGDILIMLRPGQTWGRHVLIVTGKTDHGLLTTSGNEGNTWGEREIPFNDPLMRGIVPIDPV